ncbi:hypothetical protein EYC80_000925 [Monilinia laxa]|uniref:F-box domain-containing protein n=1 Tax=Monilinia laxa TaxID=61186 RepID=A0A5N6K7N2_MONLA|nr:hypothetical protein EYC80_000925 [Monilinia laxa]
MIHSSIQRTSQGSRRQAYEAGQSPLELLPPELLQKILGNLELKYNHREGGSSNDSSDVSIIHPWRDLLYFHVFVYQEQFM